MSRKDYVKLAEDIRFNTLPGHGKDLLIKVPTFVKSLMLTLAEDNPNFNRMKFWTACGLAPEDL